MKETGESDGPVTWLFYDRRCPVCRREVALLQRWDRRGALRAVDIEEGAPCAAAYGLSRETLDARLHAVLPDGSTVSGMDAVRAAYRAVGKGWMAAPSGWPVLRPVFDAAYRWFARHRKQIGRILDRRQNLSRTGR